jgi:hypothetical protein
VENTFQNYIIQNGIDHNDFELLNIDNNDSWHFAEMNLKKLSAE